MQIIIVGNYLMCFKVKKKYLRWLHSRKLDLLFFGCLKVNSFLPFVFLSLCHSFFVMSHAYCYSYARIPFHFTRNVLFLIPCNFPQEMLP
jgi:hypothetical protein